MKAQLFKICLAFFISISAINAHENWKGKHTEEKTINKEFTVNSDALLKVNNSYGSINIATYTGNKVLIEVHIKTNGNSPDKVKERLDDINIDFTNTASLVTAKTNIKKRNSSSWWNWGNNNNVNLEINYTIKLPITNSVNLDNSYGSIYVDTLEGKATINCDYGKITTKELLAENNLLTFDYTNNSYFEYINTGKIDADYSSFTVGKTKLLEVVADYTKSVIEIAERLNYNCDYGSFTANDVNHVKGNGDYLTVRLGNVYKSLEIEADYGSLKVDKLGTNAEMVKINADYVGITIGYHQDYEFNFKIDLEYASLKHPDTFNFDKKRVESFSKYYEGYVKNSNTRNNIVINSDYGSVTFKEN